MLEGALALREWIGSGLLVVGVLCLWSGGWMGRLLPRPWSGAPDEWLPEYRRLVKRSLVTLGAGTVLALGGIACLVWPG